MSIRASENEYLNFDSFKIFTSNLVTDNFSVLNLNYSLFHHINNYKMYDDTSSSLVPLKALSNWKITDDEIEPAFFGCGGVAEIPDLQNKLIRLARGGLKHHTAICEGHYKTILQEAFTTYLGYDWVDID